MYFRVTLKNLILGKSLLFLFGLGILFSFLLFQIRERQRPFRSYTVGILDMEKNEWSSSLIEALKARNDFYFSDNPDVWFEIKKGYKKQMEKGELKDVFRIKKATNQTVQEILNDKLGSETVNRFIYFDLYQRINRIKPLTYLEYETQLKKTEKDNEILSLDVISLSGESKEVIEERSLLFYDKYLFFLLLASVGLFLNYLAGANISSLRKQGLLQRLHLSGVKRSRVILSAFFLSHLSFFSFILGFFVFGTGKNRSVFLFSLFLFELSFLIFILLEKKMKNIALFRLVAGVIMAILLGGGILYLYLKL